MCTSSNLKCNLTSGLKFIDLPCSKMLRGNEGRVLTCAQSSNLSTKATAAHTPPWVCLTSSAAPFPTSLIISHLLAGTYLEGMRVEKEGRWWKEHWGKNGSTAYCRYLSTKIQYLTTIPYDDATSSPSVGEHQRVIFSSRSSLKLLPTPPLNV